ncbi:hypothetical protein PSTG_13240 [Puccinia striiformis f. sp. tritici PST-78]|uniref:HTH La-type RNA-binding domain-containing protein n=1 Tax=Puccinia striiformis f. sp. tritici PST-78 TaxID=1165861 RepID=A0A0L0V295_9BASI|nr:hypothetical protein PSTG_13240 [Puccinia striiformis f. sp. tritici PST-78]
MTATTELPIDTLPGKLLSLDSPSTLKTKPCSQQAPPTLMPLSLKNQNHLLRPSRLLICLFCSSDQFLQFTATSVEFYFSNANLPFDKFMFLQTSTHLDSVIAPNLSAEAKKKAEGYGPGCSPVLLQMVASVKRMQPYSTKFPTSKLAKIIETSPATPKLVDVTLQKL